MNEMKYTIKELRARNNLYQRELAEKVGLSIMTINSYEKDVESLKRVSYSILEKLAKALNVEVEEIDMNRV